ncbi:MAG: tRNA adenosine(34) deaminase TadA [Gemmatimonadota bacterium]|nr:tRNA adenosine(34) deaminase TadA [Gemmatimonadota bacterium]
MGPDTSDERWMEHAIELAQEAGDAGEVPVGAVVVRDGQLVGRGRNRMREYADPCAHAEMLALRNAHEPGGAGRLDGDTLFVTLEPCFQCAGAIVLARIARVVFGAWDPRLGAAGSRFDLFGEGILGEVRVRSGLLEDRCSELLSGWFRERRARED